MDYVLGVIAIHTNDATLNSIDHFEFPPTLWTKIWEIHADLDTQLFPNDHVSYCLVPLHFLDMILYDHEAM